MTFIPEIKNTCGPIQFATCIIFEGYIPSVSILQNNRENTVEEVINDNYALLSSLYSNLDLTALGANGIYYPLTIEGIITPNAGQYMIIEASVASKYYVSTDYGDNFTTHNTNLYLTQIVD